MEDMKTTINIEIDNRMNLDKILDSFRMTKGVKKVEVERVERIPGLPYTEEERIASVHRAEEDYTAGRFKTSEEMRAKHPRI